ncbi:MAG TPA: aldehyde dehydrogenase family protein [Actinomycetota bacterium]|nr:aldehyde dehydrogenase family protein [Actinomycetota bacterium]
MREYKLFINGDWVDAESGETFETLNPSDGSVSGRVAKGDVADTRKAIVAARRASDSGVWIDMPQEERSRRMLKAWEALSAALPDLAQLEAENAGHTMRMANLFSIAIGVEHWKVLAGLSATMGDIEPVPWNDYPAPSWGFVRREPYGVTAAITPWNFPFILMMWKVAPALATGNTVVVKPASYTPLSTLEFARVLAETDLFPPGVLNVITGAGAAAGEELATNPMVDKVAFTGSTEVGRRIMQMAATNVKKVTLELGGKSANIILDDADLDIAVPGSLWATFLHQGQICHSGTRLFVPAALHDEVIARMVETAEGLRIGSALDFESDMGPLIHRSQYETVEKYVQIGLEQGAKLATGGERAHVQGHEGGYYYKPTIFADVTNGMRIAQEEIFGPVLSVIKYDSVEDAIAMANDSIYGLGGGVWSRDIPRAINVAKRIRTGTVWINDYHLLNAYAPFGGYKQSGVGRELGTWGLREYQQTKYIHVDQVPTRDQKFWLQILGL